jgi:hypothetical protein
VAEDFDSQEVNEYGKQMVVLTYKNKVSFHTTLLESLSSINQDQDDSRSPQQEGGGFYFGMAGGYSLLKRIPTTNNQIPVWRGQPK